MKLRSLAALVALVALAAVSIGAVTGPAAHYSDGKAIGDSLAAAPDTLSGLTLPDRLDSLSLWAAVDSTVLFTTQIQTASGEWHTLDTTSVTAGNVAVFYTIPAHYSGLTYRVIADNQTATTAYARMYRAVFR